MGLLAVLLRVTAGGGKWNSAAAVHTAVGWATQSPLPAVVPAESRSGPTMDITLSAVGTLSGHEQGRDDCPDLPL
jgi:hypothetical protein